MMTDYAHAAFLALRCWLHQDRRALGTTEGGLPICKECIEEAISCSTTSGS